MPKAQPLITTSLAMSRLPNLAVLLGAPIAYRLGKAAAAQGVVAWGRKPSARSAERLAEHRGLPLYRIEDGFLRSVHLGKDEPPLSVVFDDLGIYYDASTPSRLESFISSTLAPQQAVRASELIAAWRATRVSKYNHAWECAPANLESIAGTRSTDSAPIPFRYVLAVDQTLGDASIRYGLADASSFRRMLDAALAEHPDCTVVLKVHPEVMAGRKRGHFDPQALARNPRVLMLGEDVHPASLLEHARAVYAVTSQMGFEGLLWGKPVRTFGMPFYAGWGLTQDDLPAPARRKPVPLENLVHASLVDYPRYVDPETGKCCEVERVIEWIGLQRRMRGRLPQHVYAVGFPVWRRPVARAFFSGSDVRFIKRGAEPHTGAALVFWGQVPGVQSWGDARLIRMEDGFVRSVGLGSDLIRPLSLVMDTRGIYFDPTQPSDLEHILNTETFSERDVERARRVRQFIVEHGITKYNLEPREKAVWTSAGRKVVLVPGQVEDDASIRFGCTDVKTNLGLLQAARRAHPDAFIVYKPHPDVMSRNRAGKLALAQAREYADHVETRLSVVSCIEACDVVHTMTSLTGFDALVRGKRVVVYGQPFYAGWGLTEDVLQKGAAFARRQRRLSLDELVAGTLLRYPIYWDWELKGYTSCEAVLHRIVETRNALEANGRLERLRAGFFRRQIRKLGILARAWSLQR